MSYSQELPRYEQEFNKFSISPVAANDRVFTSKLSGAFWSDEPPTMLRFPFMLKLIAQLKLLDKNPDNSQALSDALVEHVSFVKKCCEELQSPLQSTAQQTANLQNKVQQMEIQARNRYIQLTRLINAHQQAQQKMYATTFAKIKEEKERQISLTERDSYNLSYFPAALYPYPEQQRVMSQLLRRAKTIENEAFKTAVYNLAQVLQDQILKQPQPKADEQPSEALSELQYVMQRTCHYIDKVAPNTLNTLLEPNLPIPNGDPVNIVAETEMYYDDCTRLTASEREVNEMAEVVSYMVTGVAVAGLFAAATVVMSGGVALPFLFSMALAGYFCGLIVNYCLTADFFGENHEKGFFAKPYQKQVEAVARANLPASGFNNDSTDDVFMPLVF